MCEEVSLSLEDVFVPIDQEFRDALLSTCGMKRDGVPVPPMSDITLHVGDVSFYANKAILAVRSPYFKAMFFSRMKESSASEVTIEEVSPDAFWVVLQHLCGYIQGKSLDAEVATGVYHFADLIQCDVLKNGIVEVFKKNIAKFWDKPDIAVLYRCFDLVTQADIPINDINSNLQAFVLQNISLLTTDQQSNIHFTTLKNIVRSSELAMKETDVFHMVLNWCVKHENEFTGQPSNDEHSSRLLSFNHFVHYIRWEHIGIDIVLENFNHMNLYSAADTVQILLDVNNSHKSQEFELFGLHYKKKREKRQYYSKELLEGILKQLPVVELPAGRTSKHFLYKINSTDIKALQLPIFELPHTGPHMLRLALNHEGEFIPAYLSGNFSSEITISLQLTVMGVQLRHGSYEALKYNYTFQKGEANWGWPKAINHSLLHTKDWLAQSKFFYIEMIVTDIGDD